MITKRGNFLFWISWALCPPKQMIFQWLWQGPQTILLVEQKEEIIITYIVAWNIWQKCFVTIGDFLYEKLFLHLLKSGYHKIMSYLTKKLLNCLCLWQEEVGTKHFIAMLFRGSTTRMLVSNLSEIASYFGLSEFPPSFVFHRWVTYSNTYLS